MNPLRREPAQLGNPPADILAFRVELLALQHGVEDAEIRSGIRAAPGRPLPSQRVVREVGVYQRFSEPARAGLPGDQQVFREE